VIALALDFDGVLSDSAPEGFAVGLEVYSEMRPASTLGLVLEGMRRRSSPGRDAITSLPAYHRFLEIIPLGNRAEDFGVALAALDEGIEFADQAAYDRFRVSCGVDFLETFHHRFYAVRVAWMESDAAGWRALMAPYGEFVAILRRHAGEVQLAIATAKDRRSVGFLLRDYGIADLFPEALIFDKETGVSKRSHLEALRRALGCPFGEITFIDDKVNHLDDVVMLGVGTMLAEWGYNGVREIEGARERGHEVCGLETAESQLFGGGI